MRFSITRRWRAIAAGLALGALVAAPVLATQDPLWSPTTGTVSGLNLTNNYNAAFTALAGCNSGGSAPTNVLGGSAVKGQCWLNTSTTPATVSMFDGVNTWVTVGWLDAVNHVWIPPIGGGTASIASAATTDLWSAQQSAGITVTGTTTITQLANASATPGTLKFVKFAAALTLTYDATKLILPGAASITTQAGDQAVVLALTSTNVSVVSYTRADGTPLAIGTFLRSYLAGLTLSIDGTSPNTVLDIAAGVAADSTNAYLIQLAAFTKATAGAWVAGTGANGMGNGLTIANTTWYNVCLARNGGVPDVWFDTSNTCANRPTAITDTAYRRIGSFKTDGSAHIIAFVQDGDYFWWKASVLDLNATNLSTTQSLRLSVPPLNVLALLDLDLQGTTSVGLWQNYVWDPDLNIPGQPSIQAVTEVTATNLAQASGYRQVRTNSSGQVDWVSNATTGTFLITTLGWVDSRGRFN